MAMTTALLALLPLLGGAVPATSPAPGAPTRPRLVVVISIDQFRADYVQRFAPYYLPAKQKSKIGGFNYLSQMGAYYTDAHYTHVPTATGPGHAAILTGSIPAVNGIVENNWFDRSTGKPVYCVDDAKSETIGGPSSPMSPRNLLVTTIGDELKMATNGKAKVVGISFKDRAAILMAGHAADTVIWLDTLNGAWVTSSFYAPSKKLPDWVTALNAQKRPDAEVGKVWTPFLSDTAYAFTRKPPFATTTPGFLFAHPTDGSGKNKFRNWTTSSFGQEYVFDTVKAAIDNEQLGQDEIPDVLAVNLATNDYIGHAYGPNSPEVMDISVRTDRLLGDLFTHLQKKIPGGLDNVAIVLTADHGVLPIVEEAQAGYRLPAVRIPDGAVEKGVSAALSKKYGAGEWVLNFSAPHLYLNQSLIASKKLDRDEVEAAAAEALPTIEGVYGGFPRRQILTGQLPKWPWTQLLTNGYYPPRAGDVVVFELPGSYFGSGTGTGHGSPWAYDSHVPILMKGFGIQSGVYNRTVAVADIASTLAQILHIELPTGNVGTPLVEVLAKK